MSEEIAVVATEAVVETVIETATEVAPAAIPIVITALAYTGAGAIAAAGCYGLYRLGKWGHGKYKARKELKAAAAATA